MEEFIAEKTYYIHDYRAICDWFGNRGIPLNKGALKEWCYDGHFLYFLCSKTAPYEITPDYEGEVMTCVFDSLYYECNDQMSYEKSPFANKIK